jgi:hypothetical protein
LAAVADLLGQPLMPWQRQVVDTACELDPVTGLPAYREVMVTVPRQSGKTTLFLAWQLDRCLNWGVPQRSAFTAQDGQSAKEKWRDELFPLIESSELAPLVRKVTVGAADTAIHFKTGSFVRVLSSSPSAGHSKTLHQAVMDEVWHDQDDRREQGLRPAMITVADAQLLVCSTAGTMASTVYNRKVSTGRQSVADDTGEGLAYFEWSAPDDWDPDDEDSWWEFMPALGRTIGPEAVRAEKVAMDPAEFRRAYGNRPTGAMDLVIPYETWQLVSDPQAQPGASFCLGVDVAEDRGSAAIVAFDGRVFELVDHRPGTAWVEERCDELTTKHGCRVARDAGGPAGSLTLKNCEDLSGKQVVQACGSIYDAILDGQVRFRADPAFDAAVEGAAKRPVGDNFVWSRKGSTTDVTPFMAATVAKACPPGSQFFAAWA